ncbi:ketopantoate reductase family protein [Colwelliaceae bacterium 6441]
MNIVIVGQGAIGLLWYFKLSQQPQNTVSIQVSQPHKPLPKFMSFTDTDNKKHRQKIYLSSKDDYKKADLVIYCLKAYAIEAAHHQYRSVINDKASIIFSHNGILPSNKNSVCKVPEHNQLLMLMTHGSLLTAPFEIKHTGLGFCDLGNLAGESNPVQIKLITATLNTALPDVYWQKNIIEKQWLKLAINCVINPLTALNDCDNGELLTKKYQLTIKDILQEFMMIAEVNKVIFNLDTLIAAVLMVANKTANNCSSMRSDILAKRKTEIDHINGFIHQEGVAHQVATPKNTQLWQEVKSREANEYSQ